MDPEVMKYFKKIMNSFVIGLLWMFVIATLGLYFQMAFVEGRLQWYNWLFYGFFLLSFILLIRIYYKIWREDFTVSK